MLFYNHKQEFIGIDDEGLKLLNYDSLEALLEVCSDVADLFAKEPGYIHNFKNFGWIDFLLHADSNATSAIVHGNGRTFSCMLQVHKLYLCAEPARNGYMIEMLHVVPISETETVSRPAVSPKPPLSTKALSEEIPAASLEPSPSVLPDYGHLTPTPLSEPGTLDIPEYSGVGFEPISELAEEPYLAPTFPEPEEAPHEEFPTPSARPAPIPKAPQTMPGGVRLTPAEQRYIDELKVDRSYRFDPSVAATELGLPVDLIQEFIGDFIQQSHDFKDDLFDAVMKGDMNNLKILSHKLKGVAANLRIEDAFECLSIINTADDIVEIEANLKYFYGIVAKLEGKEAPLNDMPETPSLPSGEEAFSALSEPLDDELFPFEPKTYDAETAFPGETTPPANRGEDIYAFSLKHGENEPLIVHPEELAAMNETAAGEEDAPAERELSFDEESVSEPAGPALHYDKSAIAGQLGIESEFFEELINDYKQDAQTAATQIGDAIAAFDTHLWKKTASQLKGISDNLRLNEISDEFAVLSRTNDAQEAHKASKRLNAYLEQL